LPCSGRGRIFLALPVERSLLGWKLLKRDGENFPVGINIYNYCMAELENSHAGMNIPNY
jgi:hypothetical protein